MQFQARSIAGEGRGRLLGSPTINLDLADVPLALGEGVYAVRCNGSAAVMHYGPRPTLGFGRSCEIHLLNAPRSAMNQHIAGKGRKANAVEVDVLTRLRDVRDFGSEEALKERIAEDIAQAKEKIPGCYNAWQMDDLLTRAVSNVIPDDLATKKLASRKPLRVYLGIDPTGTKLHLGHSVPLRKLQAFADAGHQAIFLIGSFTAMIGDPSGHDRMREPLTKEEVEGNFETYKVQAGKVLDFDAVRIVFNHEWLEKLTTADILKLASHFTKQQMEQRDLFERREREGKPISLHEFLYPVMVGYDSVMLDVDCEIGGSDQEFNMLAGRTVQQAYGKREKFVLTTKLIAGTDGRKMSKTFNNCVYLDDPPNEMYGKIMSIGDELIPDYLECCTDLEAGTGHAGGSETKKQKMRLASEIVRMYHGETAAKKAESAFETVFREKGMPDDIPEARVKRGTALIDVLIDCKLAPSKAEARRLIRQGGVKMNDKVVKSPAAKVGKEVLIKVGKRKFLRICIT